ncbi:MAG: hypothetical protein KFF73_12680, partial [Cyclobacteriaceae bacterium]|nr:hypothetical protein [Cyclobacteriaceae bacterium]
MEDYLILSGLWLLYGVIHSLFASNRMKRFFQAWAGPWYRYYRITFSFFSIILLIPVLWYQSGIPGRMLYEQQVATVFSGLALATAGIMIVKISFEQYDLHEFIGMR